RQIVETSAIEIGRTPDRAQATVERKFVNYSHIYPALSIAVVPLRGTPGVAAGGPVVAHLVASGPWAHGSPPAPVPKWVIVDGGFDCSHTRNVTGSCAALMATSRPGQNDPLLVMRATAETPDGASLIVADLPLDADGIGRLRTRTGTRIGEITVTGCGLPAQPGATPRPTNTLSLFRETVAFLTCASWTDPSAAGAVAVNIEAPVAGVYERLATVSGTQG